MSEIARLRRLIELECEAMKLAMYGIAIVSSHQVIDHKYHNLGTAQEKLAELVGEEEAARVLVEVYTEVIG
ncbi:MAG: hypothetical protein J2P36_01815 [Ktedonobacteraceae bacterium]|nr:hypothetical protein [Ktedonobacteraceae bacterium]